MLSVGIDRSYDRVQALVSRCLDGLAERSMSVVTPHEPAQRAGVIVLNHADPQRVFAVCA